MRLLAALICLLTPNAAAFVVRPGASRTTTTRTDGGPAGTIASNKATSLHSSREEEIARLEEQLRQLKAEEGINRDAAQNEEYDESSATATTTSTKQELIDSFTQSTSAAQREKLFVDRQVILSEQELVSVMEEDGEMANQDGDGGGGLLQPILAVVGLVALIAFSQVPIGQEDLSKYSATGSSAVKTIDLGDLNTDVVSRP